MKVFSLFILLFALLPTTALAASGRVDDKDGKSRLVIKLDNFSDKGRWRIRAVEARFGQKRWNINRSRHPFWSSGYRSELTNLAGKQIRVIVKRKEAKTKAFDLLLPQRENSPTPNPETPPTTGPENPQYKPGISNLAPQWSKEEADFTTLCRQGEAAFEVNTDQLVSFDGQENKSGNFKARVPLTVGQSFSLRVGDNQPQSVRCRPDDLPLAEVEKLGQASSQFYLVAPTLGSNNNYVMIINQSGVPVWWYKDMAGAPVDFKMLDNQTLSWVRGVGPFSVLSNHYDIRSLDGSITQTVSPVGYGADHHDMQRTSDGGYLFVIYAPRDCPNTPSDCEDLSAYGGPSQANVIDGVIQKVDASGKLVWQWNSRDHISLEESGPWIRSGGTQTTLPNGSTAYDIIHLNSVEEDGAGFVFSARHLDAVIRAEPSSENIDWKLGGTNRAESLTVEDDPFSTDPLAGQHDARILKDGSLTIHENGSRRGRPPRVVRYQIEAGKARLIESFTDIRAPSSFCCGGARRLSDGHWVVSWGANSVTGEYDGQGNPVRRFYWPGGAFSYRVIPSETGQLDESDLRKGMDDQFPRK